MLTAPRLGFVTSTVVGYGLVLSGCGVGHGPPPAYLDPASSRPRVISSLSEDYCSGRMRVIEDSRYYWVGLCQDRTAFEDRVFFMAFASRAQRDHYLARLESCFDEGRYLEGPRWFAMAVTRSDAATLRDGGGSPVRCG